MAEMEDLEKISEEASGEEEKKPEAMDDAEILREIRKRFKESFDADRELYDLALEDLRFLNGEDQWQSDIKSQREQDGRPCLVINKLPTFCDQIIGDLRANEPSLKIKPVDSTSDPDTAEILTGLVRNIEVQSDAEIAYDTACESAIQCGIGAWRIDTEYASDDAFEQDIKINRITNPFTIHWDPKAKRHDKSDARFCFVTERIPKEEFEDQWPDKAATDAEGGRDKSAFWGDDKTVRIVEYWKKVPVKKTIYMVQATNRQTGMKSEPAMTETEPDQERLAADPKNSWEVLKSREVDTFKLVWWKASQGDILEGPSERPGKLIPIVMCYGKELVIEGNIWYRGIVRNAKDPQRLYNYSRSTRAELLSLAPKAPWLVSAPMIQNYQEFWRTASKKNWPYLPYEFDKANPAAMPRRGDPVNVNPGIEQEVAASDQEIRDTTGLQQASLGMKSNEKSGRAILARQKEGDVANFAFHDNLARAIKYSGKVILDLIPKIYDTPRIVRVLGKDDKDQFVPVNQPFQKIDSRGQAIQKIYDLTMGKYDVVVSIGPSYTTEREEAANSMLEFMKVFPPAAPLIADLLAKNLDWPGADEIEKRLKILLPPPLQQGTASPPQPGGPNAGAPPPGGPPAPPPRPDPMQQLEMRSRIQDMAGKELENQKKFIEMKRAQREYENPPERQ